MMGLGLVAATLTVCVGPATAEKAAKPRMKIGVYDSSGVVIACARSPEFRESMARLFKPDEQTLKILGELKDQKPVPFDEVPLDGND